MISVCNTCVTPRDYHKLIEQKCPWSHVTRRATKINSTRHCSYASRFKNKWNAKCKQLARKDACFDSIGAI